MLIQVVSVILRCFFYFVHPVYISSYIVLIDEKLLFCSLSFDLIGRSEVMWCTHWIFTTVLKVCCLLAVSCLCGLFIRNPVVPPRCFRRSLSSLGSHLSSRLGLCSSADTPSYLSLRVDLWGMAYPGYGAGPGGVPGGVPGQVRHRENPIRHRVRAEHVHRPLSRDRRPAHSAEVAEIIETWCPLVPKHAPGCWCMITLKVPI